MAKVSPSNPPLPDKEREAFVCLKPSGFLLRPPPPPHQLDAFITQDDSLFQTIHMGAAEVDLDKYVLIVSGMVETPYSVTLEQLKRLPSKTISAFHECYGSPLKPPTTALWRVGNVIWTGVPLCDLLDLAKPNPEAHFVWSEGLDRGDFAGVEADRYQKDLPMSKAQSPDVLVAYEMNGQPLSKNRGGPVRLVVPGWYGTNSTKWLCKLSCEAERAKGPFTTRWYNEKTQNGGLKPVWEIAINSMIVIPAPDAVMAGPSVSVQGWSWSSDGIDSVEISADDGKTWKSANVERRRSCSWQRFKAEIPLSAGKYKLMAKATSCEGVVQPLAGARNHAHHVHIQVQ